jgi:hypothetical protein
MANGQDDYQDLMEMKRFMGVVEQGIRAANREIIHKHIDSIDHETVLTLGVSVAKLRANYLAAAFNAAVEDHGAALTIDEVADLKNAREMYEEARAGFEALTDAIEKGYVDVNFSKSDE